MDVLTSGILRCSSLYCHVHYFVALASIDTLIVSWQWMLLSHIDLRDNQPYSYEQCFVVVDSIAM
jgi:hypothetical protein